MIFCSTDVTFSAGQSIPIIDISYGYGIISDLLVVPSSIHDTLQGNNLSVFDTESSVANTAGTLVAQHGVTVFVPEGMYPFRQRVELTVYSLLQQTPPSPQPMVR